MGLLDTRSPKSSRVMVLVGRCNDHRLLALRYDTMATARPSAREHWTSLRPFRARLRMLTSTGLFLVSKPQVAARGAPVLLPGYGRDMSSVTVTQGRCCFLESKGAIFLRRDECSVDTSDGA